MDPIKVRKLPTIYLITTIKEGGQYIDCVIRDIASSYHEALRVADHYRVVDGDDVVLIWKAHSAVDKSCMRINGDGTYG